MRKQNLQGIVIFVRQTHHEKDSKMTSVAPVIVPVVLTVVPGLVELEKVESTENSDYYAIWDAQLGWIQDSWVQVRVDAPANDVISAFHRGMIVSGL